MFACLFFFMNQMESLFQIYELRVMETKPDKAVSIIECDMNVRANCCITKTTGCNSVVFCI